MENKELKQEIISKGKYSDFKKARKQSYKYGDLTGFEAFDDDELKACYQLNDCKKKQRQKVEDHLNFMFECSNADLFFATFTFNDESMKLKPSTRKTKIIRLLRSCLNIDLMDNSTFLVIAMVIVI